MYFFLLFEVFLRFLLGVSLRAFLIFYRFFTRLYSRGIPADVPRKLVSLNAFLPLLSCMICARLPSANSAKARENVDLEGNISDVLPTA